MTETVAHAIVRQLEARDVPRAYHVPGESFLGLLDALRDSPIRIVTARQEGGAGFMALAEGRLTGRAGVVMVTRGPGAANLAIAIHTAYQDGTPLVAFVGLVPTSDRGKESFQEFDLTGWFGSTTKATIVLDDPRSAGERVARAFDLAQSGRPGPVVIGLPEERLTEIVHDQRTYTPAVTGSTRPDDASCAAMVSALTTARHPVFVVGGDDWDLRSAGVLRTLAERWSIPVVSDFRAHDQFPHSSAAWVGSLGFGRNPAAAEAYGNADLVCYLGAVRSDVLSDGYTLGGDEATTMVVGPDPDLRGHVGVVGTHVVCRPADWLDAVSTGSVPTDAGELVVERGARLERLRAEYAAWSTAGDPGPAGAALDAEAVYGVLARVLPADAVVTVGAGNYVIGALRYLHRETPRSFVGPRNGAMGLGVPGAVAATLVHPDRTVVAFAGDGCFGMNGLELATLAATGSRALVFVLDNAGFGTIRTHQEREFPDRPAGTYLENPDFAALGRAHGFDAHRFEHLEGFEERVVRAIGSGRPTLFHLVLPRIGAGTGEHDGGAGRPR